jgi:hypothetical protein
VPTDLAKDNNKDDDVYPNIRRSYLQNVGVKSIVIPCFQMVKWIIDDVNLDNMMTINEHGKFIASTHPNNMEMYYMCARGKLSMTPYWVEEFEKQENYHKVMIKWWIE